MKFFFSQTLSSGKIMDKLIFPLNSFSYYWQVIAQDMTNSIKYFFQYAKI